MESWEYVSEGGKHVIFSSTAKEYNGRLLRVRRGDLIATNCTSSSRGEADVEADDEADDEVDYEAESSSSTPSTSSSCTNASVDFLRRIVYPILAPYFDIPHTIELPAGVASKLMKKTIESGKIAASRKISWTSPKSSQPRVNSDAFKASNNTVLGTLLYDCKRIAGHDKACWSVEIKPKAGYLAFSPLIHPAHRIKLKQTRFSIQQQLLACGVVRKGWISGATRVSAYNPLDLFSGDLAKVERAMQALLLTPQNNLRIWSGDVLVFGHEVEDMPEEERKSIIRIIAVMLCAEKVLAKLLAMQLLDVIDADGAVMIYRRMVRLCNGDSEEADRLLDQVPMEAVSQQTGSGCLAASPFLSSKSTVLDRLLGEIELFPQVSSTPEKLDEATTRAQALIYELSKSDCIFLLQNWLLSLAMCDVSVMIALAPVNNVKKLSMNDQWSCKKCQSKLHGGVLESGSSKWTYAIKVVDCDNKPANKLRKRGEKEGLILKL